MIKPGQKRKILYTNAIEYTYKEKKYVYRTIKNNCYIIDCRDDENGHYGFHYSSWAVEEYDWLFTEEDLNEIKDYDGDSIYIIYSERPDSKEEMQAKVKEFLEAKKQRYINRIDEIINEIYEA